MLAAQITQDIQTMEQIAVAMMERTRPATARPFLAGFFFMPMAARTIPMTPRTIPI